MEHFIRVRLLGYATDTSAKPPNIDLVTEFPVSCDRKRSGIDEENSADTDEKD
jgi:hypothetical protein